MFDRWTGAFRNSFTLRRFNEHQTEINRLYWSLIPAAGFAGYLARHAPAGETPATLFHASGPNAHRIASDLPSWQRDFTEFGNWVRLSALVSLLSYLETYITTVATLALRSDPLLRFNQSRTVDGTLWLKREVVDDVSGFVTPLVKGKWPQRCSAYRTLFGSVPAVLDAHVGDLDQMREMRNGVAHSFGRDVSFFENPIVRAGQPLKLGEERLQNWLAIVKAAAAAIDGHLYPVHLGDFELIWRYHRWRHEPRHVDDRGYTAPAAFCRTINRDLGALGRDHCEALIAYYDGVGP